MKKILLATVVSLMLGLTSLQAKGNECTVTQNIFASPDSSKAFSEMLQVLQTRNEKAIQLYIEQGKAYFIDKGTKVIIIDSHIGKKSIFVLTGKYKGKKMRINTEFLNCN